MVKEMESKMYWSFQDSQKKLLNSLCHQIMINYFRLIPVFIAIKHTSMHMK